MKTRTLAELIRSRPKIPNPFRALRIAFLEHELANRDYDIAAEERRQVTHEARMKAWRADRQELLGRIMKLKGAQGSVIWTAMTRRNAP